MRLPREFLRVTLCAMAAVPSCCLLHPLERVCYNKDPFLITAAGEVSGFAGNGVYSGAGIDAQGNFRASGAKVGTHMLTYTYTTDDGCSSADSTPMKSPP